MLLFPFYLRSALPFWLHGLRIGHSKWGGERQSRDSRHPDVQPELQSLTQGVLAVTRPLGSSTIDFGDGNCDDEATVTTANDNVFALDLHRFPG